MACFGIENIPAKIRNSYLTRVSFLQLRVLKLAQSWKTMGQLLSTIGNSIGALGNITVILGIIIYIFAVVGMQLFGNKYTLKIFPEGIPRYNFNNFGNSFMMIFRILCGKWIEPQWDLLKATDAFSIVFIFMVFVIGRWVVSFIFMFLQISIRKKVSYQVSICAMAEVQG